MYNFLHFVVVCVVQCGENDVHILKRSEKNFNDRINNIDDRINSLNTKFKCLNCKLIAFCFIYFILCVLSVSRESQSHGIQSRLLISRIIGRGWGGGNKPETTEI